MFATHRASEPLAEQRYNEALRRYESELNNLQLADE